MCGCQMSNAPWHFDALITVGEVDHSVSHAALVKGETERLLDETCDKTRKGSCISQSAILPRQLTSACCCLGE